MPMGRKRARNHNLPPRLHPKGGVWYHVSSTTPRKWTALGPDLARARTEWARIENAGSASGTVSALIDAYLTRCLDDKAINTRRNYTRMAEVLRKVFGTMPIPTVRPTHIGDYLDKHRSKLIANNEINLLSGMYAMAMRWGWAESNPCRGVRRNPIPKRERYITDDEFTAIYGAVDEPVRIAMDLANLTGLRIGDVLKIHLADIKPDGLHVRQQKTKRAIVFEITPELQAIIERAKALPRAIRTLDLLTSSRGRAYSPNTIYRRFVEAAKKLGILDVHFHDLRAKVATDEPDKAQERLDHRDQRTTDGYIRKPRGRIVPIARKAQEL